MLGGDLAFLICQIKNIYKLYVKCSDPDLWDPLF